MSNDEDGEGERGGRRAVGTVITPARAGMAENRRNLFMSRLRDETAMRDFAGTVVTALMAIYASVAQVVRLAVRQMKLVMDFGDTGRTVLS